MRTQFFLYEKCAETPMFIVFFDKLCFENNKLGPVNNY